MRKRALYLAAGLVLFLVLLGGFGVAAWCDETRFGYFMQASPAPADLPHVDFTKDDARAHPDVQRALDRPGYPVRAEDVASARAWIGLMEEQHAAAVRAAVDDAGRTGLFYVTAYEQTPSERWTRACT
ncbi:MAG TPA: hypothetical protein VI997_00710 [Candidatus Thermoplasmatota archaeon]|nr:hypothetical protein [Candidatus Thermoplasmatota archaeon]